MYRVIQWTTGNVGRRSLRAIVDHPELELVGLYAHGTDKRGRDAGELAGIGATGVRATGDVEELLALGADCLCFNGLFSETELLARFLGSGTNVVTTAAFLTANHLPPGERERLVEAAERGGASLFGSGINPGFMDMITAALTGVCERVHSIRMTENVDCSSYASPGTWEHLGWGRPPGNQPIDPASNAMTGAFYDGLDLIAGVLGVELVDYANESDFALATRDIDLGWMAFPKGSVAGQRTTFAGIAEGRRVIELCVVWTMADDLEPQWPGPRGYTIEIDGEPGVRASVEIGPSAVEGVALESDHMDRVMVATALPAVHAIPHVCRARPGIVGYRDLPLFGAAQSLVDG